MTVVLCFILSLLCLALGFIVILKIPREPTTPVDIQLNKRSLRMQNVPLGLAIMIIGILPFVAYIIARAETSATIIITPEGERLLQMKERGETTLPDIDRLKLLLSEGESAVHTHSYEAAARYFKAAYIEVLPFVAESARIANNVAYCNLKLDRLSEAYDWARLAVHTDDDDAFVLNTAE